MNLGNEEETFRQNRLKAERRLLALVLANRDACLEFISGSQICNFVLPIHEQLYSDLLKCQHRGIEVSANALIKRVNSADEAHMNLVSSYICGLEELGALMPDEPCSRDEVRNYAIRSCLLDIGQRMAKAALGNDGFSGTDLIECFEQELYDLYRQSTERQATLMVTSLGELPVKNDPQLEMRVEAQSRAGESFSDVARQISAGRLICIKEVNEGAGLQLMGDLVARQYLHGLAISSVGLSAGDVLRHLFGHNRSEGTIENKRSNEKIDCARKTERDGMGYCPTSIYVDDQASVSISALRQKNRYQKRRYDMPVHVILSIDRVSRFVGDEQLDQTMIRSRNLSDLKRLAGEIDTAIVLIETCASIQSSTVDENIDAIIEMVAGQRNSKNDPAEEIRILSRA